MAENQPEQEAGNAGLRQMLSLPFILGVLGGGALLAGFIIPLLSHFSAEIGKKIEDGRDSFFIPALLITIGILLICLCVLIREIKSLDRKISALTEHAFDREVASLLAALRPFAERLEERIGPVLTAAQKLVKPLDAIHADVTQQSQKLLDISGSYEEMKLLLARVREDLVLANRNKPLEALQKNLEQLASQLQNLQQQRPESPSFEPLQKIISQSIAEVASKITILQSKQDALTQSLDHLRTNEKDSSEKLRGEISKSQTIANQALEAASSAATAAQRAAEAAERAVTQFEKMDSPAPKAAPASPAPSVEPAPAPPTLSGGTETVSPPKSETSPSSSPQEKRSIKDAISKLRQFRGGNS